MDKALKVQLRGIVEAKSSNLTLGDLIAKGNQPRESSFENPRIGESKEFPFHLPATADKLATEIYLTLHELKAAMDRMEEIPKSLQPLYDQTMKALGVQDRLRVETDKLRQMAKKLAAQ